MPSPTTSGILRDLLRHAAARAVLRNANSAGEERRDARAVLGLSDRTEA